jgi:hypothetical protein
MPIPGECCEWECLERGFGHCEVTGLVPALPTPAPVSVADLLASPEVGALAAAFAAHEASPTPGTATRVVAAFEAACHRLWRSYLPESVPDRERWYARFDYWALAGIRQIDLCVYCATVNNEPRAEGSTLVWVSHRQGFDCQHCGGN